MLALLLAVAVADSPKKMTLVAIDDELRSIVFDKRGGWLWHQLTHYECDRVDRQRYRRDVASEYASLEREYRRLGGTVAVDDEQDIMLETVHYRCAGGPVMAERMWDDEVVKVDASLARMRALLDRKKQLRRTQQKGSGS